MSVHRLLRPTARARLRKMLPMSQWRWLQTLAARDSAAHRQAGIWLARRGLKSLRPAVAVQVVPVSHRGLAYWAHPVTRFKTEDVIEDNFEIVRRVLENAGIVNVAMPPLTHRPRIVVVDEKDRRACADALTSELKPEAIYACLLFDDELGGVHRIGERELRGDFSGIRIFRFLAAASREFLSGSLLGCEIQFWSGTPTGTDNEELDPSILIAPKLNNPWTDVLPALDTIAPALQSASPRQIQTSHPHAFEMTNPIDVVYTWVDGADPWWLHRKAASAAGVGQPTPHPLASNDSRYLSRDELRYSLRSLEMYAGWARHIYLVTDRQVPDWLRTDHPKLTIVDHTEIFADRGCLPTFNSHAIESQLHHIDGLSEHFLYLNDDVFFGAAATPELFFHSNGTPKFFRSKAKIGLGAPSDADPPVVTAGKNNRTLLEQTFGVSITSRLQHAPHALRRSVLAEIELRYPAEVCRTAHSQFRSRTDISMAASLAHYYGYFTGRAIPGTLRYFYADIARQETPLRLDALLWTRDADTFCLNDIDSSADQASTVTSMVRTFLESYFPLPSTFEEDPM